MGLYVGHLIDPRAAARAMHAAAPVRGDVEQVSRLSLVLERGALTCSQTSSIPQRFLHWSWHLQRCPVQNQSIHIAIISTVQIQKRTTASSSDALDHETKKCASVYNPNGDGWPYG